jgi:hypothetical protein
MTARMDSGTRKDPGSAVVLAMALIAVISTEAIYLEGFWKGQEELRKANDQLEAGISQSQRRIVELRAASQKISATFTRLNDGIIRVPGTEGRLSTPGRNSKDDSEYDDSKVAKSLREYGLLVKLIQESRREASVSFEVGSNHLELHRLLPLLAEQENSNAFLYIDKLDLTRPDEIPAFSTIPAGLQSRLQIRVLSGPK